MAYTEVYRVLNNWTVITSCHNVTPHRTSGVDADNLITLADNPQWSLPGILSGNIWPLVSEKSDELIAVGRMNDTACVGVIETPFKNYVLSKSVVLNGFSCNLKNQMDEGGERMHGVLCGHARPLCMTM